MAPDHDIPFTAEEQAWWRLFKRVIRKMPKSVELHARIGGEIGIAPVGSRVRVADEDKDCDDITRSEWDYIFVPRLDGRDSQL